MSATLSAGAAAIFRDYDKNARWALSHGAELEKYEGLVVVIVNEKIVASAKTREALAQKISEFPGAYVGRVPKKGLLWIL